MSKKDQHWFTTARAQVVSFTSDGCVPTVMDENKHEGLYLMVGDYSKLGFMGKVHNMTPVEAFQERYAGSGSSHLDSKRYEVPRLYVCDKNVVEGMLDKVVHEQINKEHKKGNCPFYCPMDNATLNYEGFVNFDANNDEHIRILESIIEAVVKRKPTELTEFRFRHKSQENDFNCVLWMLKNSSLSTRKKYFRRLKENFVESGKWNEETVRFQYNVLWQAMCGSGKTTLSPKLISELSEVGDVCLFLTPIVDTMESFVDNCNNKFYGKPIKVLASEDFENKNKTQRLALINEHAKTHIVVICLSVQDMRYDDGNGQIREKYSFLESLPLKVAIRDEAHMHYNAAKTAKKMGLLNVEYLIDLTATTYKLLDKYGHIYSHENILDRDLFYCMMQKKNGNKDYALIPNMECHIVDILSDDPEIAALREKHGIPAKDNFSSEKLWLVVNEGKSFYSNDMLMDVMRFVSNGSPIRHRPKHISYSSYYDVGSVTDIPWIKHIIPEGGGEQGCQAKDKIDLAVTLLNSDPKSNTLYISADEFLNIRDIEIRDIEGSDKVIGYFNAKAKGLGKKYVAIVTHRQLLVGSDIVPSCFTYVWDNITSPDLLEQIQGRDVRVWTKIDENGNVVNLKPTSRIFFMNQGMKLALPYMINQCIKDKVKNNPEYKGKERELCGCINVVEHLNNGKTTELSYKDILSRFNEHRKKQLIAGGEATYSQFNIPEVREWMYNYRSLHEDLGNLMGKSGKPTVDVTHKNGAKTYDSNGDTPHKNDTNNKKSIEDKAKKQIADDIRAMCMVISVLPFVYIASGKKIKNVMDAIEHDFIQNEIDPKMQRVIQKMFEEVPEARSLADDYLKESAREIHAMSPEQLAVSKYFYNVPCIKRVGVVFIEPKFVESELMPVLTGTNNKPEGVVVFNALNGSIPAMVKKLDPTIPIICIETDEYFTNHLTSMGCKTYLYSNDSWRSNPMKDLNGKEIDKSKIQVVMNPPYNNKLDLKFIKSAIEISNRVLVVHPADSTISRKNTKKIIEHKKLIDGHVKSIKMFNGNPVFGIGLFYPCQIMDIDMNNKYDEFEVEYAFDGETKKYNFSSIFDVTKWGNIKEYYSLEKKILDYCENKKNCHEKWDPEKGKWFVNMAKIRGNVNKSDMLSDDFYTFIPSDLIPENLPKKFISIGFETRKESENFIEYLKSDFARFCLSIYKNNADLESGELKSVPYLPSYKTPWTKERLTELFNITDAEWDFIEKVIPKYY